MKAYIILRDRVFYAIDYAQFELIEHQIKYILTICVLSARNIFENQYHFKSILDIATTKGFATVQNFTTVSTTIEQHNNMYTTDHTISESDWALRTWTKKCYFKDFQKRRQPRFE